ncbi:MAG: aminotransferase class V-fold PLP-dependent enzyme [Waddliaceae bacterium]
MFLPYARQTIDQNDIDSLSQVLTSDWITRGEKTAEFEEAVARYVGAKYAVAFNSGTSALHASAFAVNLNPQDRFLTTPNSFIASSACGIARGAIPRFIDIDRKTGSLDLSLVEKNINQPISRGKTVFLPVHFAGIPFDVQKISQILKDPGAVIIEDAAHAFGSQYKDGQMVGSCAFSDLTVFSFHPAKTITTGEGGMVTTNDPNLYERLKLFRNNGIERKVDIPWEYDIKETTGNFHLTDFQAALGLSQLKRVDEFISKRRIAASHYRKLLSDFPHLEMFSPELDEKTAHHLFVVQIDFDALGTSREVVMRALLEKGVGTQLHYIPLYRHSAIENISGDISDYFPEMERYYSRTLSLPLYPLLELKEIERVVKNLRETVGI